MQKNGKFNDKTKQVLKIEDFGTYKLKKFGR